MALVAGTPGNNYFKRRSRADHDWQKLGFDGQAWLKAHGCTTGTIDHCRAIGYGLMIYELNNSRPGKIRRASVILNTGGAESVVGPEDYGQRLAKWEKARDRWVVEEILPQHGLRVTPKVSVEIDREKDAEQYTNKLLDRVRGKGLVKYQQPGTGVRPAPEGMKWVLEREKAKPRGLPFRKGKDERRYQHEN